MFAQQPHPQQPQEIMITSCPTIDQFQQTLYNSYCLGDHQATLLLQAFQRSQFIWNGADMLFSLQTITIPGLQLAHVHHYASYAVLDKVRSEWRSVKLNNPEGVQAIKTMLGGHFATIVNYIQAGVYSNLSSLAHTILSNLAEALSTVAVLDNDCRGFYQFVTTLQASSPAIALIILTTLANINDKARLSQSTEKIYNSFLSEQFGQVIALCEDYLTPLAALFNKDANPYAFSPISASLVSMLPQGTPSNPDYANCPQVTFAPFYNQTPQNCETFTVHKLRGLSTLTPLVSMRTYLQVPKTITIDHLVSSSDLMFTYRHYPISQQASLAADDNIISLTLRCIKAWLKSFTSISNFLHLGKGLTLHFLLTLLPFERYTPLVLDILTEAFSRRSHPLPALHKHATMLVAKVMVEFSLRLQSRSLFANIANYLNDYDRCPPQYQQDNNKSPNGLFCGNGVKVGANQCLVSYEHTPQPMTNLHLLSLLHTQQRLNNIPSQVQSLPVEVEFLTNPDEYLSIISNYPQHYLTQQYSKYLYFFNSSNPSSPSPMGGTAPPPNPALLFEGFINQNEIAKVLRRFVGLIVGFMEHDSSIFINGPRPIISLTNFILLTLANPQLSHSLNSLEFFVAIQDVLFADRGYLFQQPLFVVFFIITSLQLARPGLAMLWLTQNPDHFDAIGSLGSTKHGLEEDGEVIGNVLKGIHQANNTLPIFDHHPVPYLGENNFSQLELQNTQTLLYLNQMGVTSNTLQQQQQQQKQQQGNGNTINYALGNDGLGSQGQAFQGTLPVITQQMLSTLPEEQLQKTLITNLNTTPLDYYDLDCTTVSLFTSQFFLSIAYDDQCDDLEANRARFIHNIKETMFDLYKIFDISLITFFFRTLGLALPPSMTLLQQAQAQQNAIPQGIVSMPFLGKFFDSNQPYAMSPLPTNSIVPSSVLSTSYPQTGLICNDGTSLDQLELLPFPRNGVTGEKVSLIELYSYLQHVPLLPTLSQITSHSQTTTNNPQTSSAASPNINNITNIGHISEYIPYIIPDTLDCSIYYNFTQSVLKIITALASSCFEGFSQYNANHSLDRALNCSDLSQPLDPNAPRRTLNEQYCAGVLKEKIITQIDKIPTLTALFYHLINTISHLPILPSFINHPKHSLYHLGYPMMAQRGQMGAITGVQKGDEIDNDARLINHYTNSSASQQPSSSQSTSSLKSSQFDQQGLVYIQPLAFPLLSLFASYSFVFPIMHPATINYMTFLIQQLVARGSSSLMSFLDLMNHSQLQQLTGHVLPTTAQMASNGIDFKGNNTNTANSQQQQQQDEGDIVQSDDYNSLNRFSLDLFITKKLTNIMSTSPSNSNGTWSGNNTNNTNNGNPYDEALLSVLLLILRDLELSPTQSLKLTSNHPATLIELLSTPPPSFTFNVNGFGGNNNGIGVNFSNNGGDNELHHDYHPAQLGLLASLTLFQIGKHLSFDENILFTNITNGCVLIETPVQLQRLHLVQSTLHQMGLYITPSDSHFVYSILASSFAKPNTALLHLQNHALLYSSRHQGGGVPVIVTNLQQTQQQSQGQQKMFDLTLYYPIKPFTFNHYSTNMNPDHITPINIPQPQQLQSNKALLQMILSKSCELPQLFSPQCNTVFNKTLGLFVSTFPSELSHLITTSLLDTQLNHVTVLSKVWLGYFTAQCNNVIGNDQNGNTFSLTNQQQPATLQKLETFFSNNKTLSLLSYLITTHLQTRLDGFQPLIFLTKPHSEVSVGSSSSSSFISSTTSTSYLFGQFSEGFDQVRFTASQLTTNLLTTISSLFQLSSILTTVVPILCQPELLAAKDYLMPGLSAVAHSMSSPLLPPHRWLLRNNHVYQQLGYTGTASNDQSQGVVFKPTSQPTQSLPLAFLLHSQPFYHQLYLLTTIPLKSHIIEAANSTTNISSANGHTNSGSMTMTTTIAVGLTETITRFIISAIETCPSTVSPQVPTLLNSLTSLLSQFTPATLLMILEQYNNILGLVQQHGKGNGVITQRLVEFQSTLNNFSLRIERLWSTITSLLGLFKAAVKEYGRPATNANGGYDRQGYEHQRYFISSIESILNCVLDTIYIHSLLNELTNNDTINPTVTASNDTSTKEPRYNHVLGDILSLPLANPIFSHTVLTATPVLNEVFSVFNSFFNFGLNSVSKFGLSLNTFLAQHSSPIVVNGGNNTEGALPSDYILQNKFLITHLLSELKLYSFSLFFTSSTSIITNLTTLNNLCLAHCATQSATTNATSTLKESLLCLTDLSHSMAHSQQTLSFFTNYITQSLQYDNWFQHVVGGLVGNGNGPNQLTLSLLLNQLTQPNQLPSPYSTNHNNDSSSASPPQNDPQYDTVAQLRLMGLIILATANQYPAIDSVIELTGQYQQANQAALQQKQLQIFPREQLLHFLTTIIQLNPDLVIFTLSLIHSIAITPHQIKFGFIGLKSSAPYRLTNTGAVLLQQQSLQHLIDPTLPLLYYQTKTSGRVIGPVNDNDDKSKSVTLLGFSPLTEYITTTITSSNPNQTLINLLTTLQTTASIVTIGNHQPVGTGMIVKVGMINEDGTLIDPSRQQSQPLPPMPLTSLHSNILHTLALCYSANVSDSPTQQRIGGILMSVWRNVPCYQVVSWMEMLFVNTNRIIPERFNLNQRLFLTHVMTILIDNMIKFLHESLWTWHYVQLKIKQQNPQQSPSTSLSNFAQSLPSLFDTSPSSSLSNSTRHNSSTQPFGSGVGGFPKAMDKLRGDFKSKTTQQLRKFNVVMKDLWQIINSSSENSLEKLSDSL